MSQIPLMPRATALWLIENTSLSFEQISEFCGLHVLEVQSMADGDSSVGLIGISPVDTNQLSREEIERCQADTKARLNLNPIQKEAPQKGGRYVPVKQRQDRPDAIAWIIKHHPEITDAQICRLIGTTKHTIEAVRTKSHRNMAAIKPQDPVLLGLCLQKDLNAVVKLIAQKGEQKQA